VFAHQKTPIRNSSKGTFLSAFCVQQKSLVYQAVLQKTQFKAVFKINKKVLFYPLLYDGQVPCDH